MRLLLLGINYEPEIISTAVYSTGLAEHLSANGFEVKVVTAKPYYPAWRVTEAWRRPLWVRRRSKSGVGIIHCPLYVPSEPGGTKRILHHASFALAALPVTIWKALTWRPDIVMVVAPSLLSAQVGLLAGRLCAAGTWLHVQDFEVDVALASGLLPKTGRVEQAARWFERLMLRCFDRVSSISPEMIETLARNGVEKHRTFELRNWANLSDVTPLSDISPLKDELGISTRYVALYSGNLANKQGLEILPDMARRLADRADLSFVVCGDGPMREKLRQAAEGLKNFRLLDLQPAHRLNDLLGMADVHLLPQIAGAADLVMPSKLTNMLASGRPVLATAAPDTALGREVNGAGRIVPPGDAEAAARTLCAMLDAPDERAAMGAEARRRALERWDMSIVMQRFLAELRDLAGPNTVEIGRNGRERA